MSSLWQAYIDRNIVKSQLFSHGAIYGLNGTKWAQSQEIELTKSQVKNVLALLEEEKQKRLQQLLQEGFAHSNNCNPSPLPQSTLKEGQQGLKEQQQFVFEIQASPTPSFSSTSSLSILNDSSSFSVLPKIITFHKELPFLVLKVNPYFCLLATWSSPAVSSPSSLNANSSPPVSPNTPRSNKNSNTTIAPLTTSTLSSNNTTINSEIISNLDLNKVFDEDKQEFLILPKEMFYCVTTTKCLLIGKVVLKESSNNTNRSMMNGKMTAGGTSEPFFSIASRTLDKFADYLIESGF
ncbi:hypothetical protein ABK040_001375 [Willaertia magna]